VKNKKSKKAPKDCKECSRWQAIKQKLRISESLAKTIEQIEKRISADDFKPTVGDYVKLLQIEKDLEEETPKEITVTWVEPAPESKEE
jgi:hypothetical protein